MTTPSPQTAPRWALACDGVAVGLALVAVWIALTGGGRYLLLGLVLSLRSPLLFVYAAAALLVVRHLLAPVPNALAGARAIDAAVVARPALAAALRAFAATRPLVFVVAVFAVMTLGFPAKRGELRVSNDPLINLPARFDAGWYGGIALDGYSWQRTFGPQQEIAFFPALPLLSRGLGAVFGMYADGLPRESRMARALWAGVAISLLAFLWALHYLYRYAGEVAGLGADAASHAVMLLAAYPFALFFNAPYTEGVFLLAAVGAAYHFAREDWAAASVWGLVAGLSRPNGCLLSIPLGLLALQHGLAFRRTGVGRAAWRAVGVRLAVAGMPGVGMLAFTAYLYQLTGVWFAWARSHAAWGRTFQGLSPITTGIERLSTEPFVQVLQTAPYEAINTLGLLFTLALIWPTFRRIGLAWGTFALVNVAMPLMAGGVLSLGRVTSTLFPLFLALAAVLPARAALPCAVAFAVLQGLFAALFFTWRDLY